VVIRDIFQTLVIKMAVGFVLGGSNPETSVLNLLLVLAVMEWIPLSSGRGYFVTDLRSFESTISFVFADSARDAMVRFGFPLLGAALGLCFGGSGLMGRTLTLTGVSVLSSVLLDAIGGGQLSFSWPVILLYFAYELCGRYPFAVQFLEFGQYKASDAAYQGVRSLGASSGMIAVFFAVLSPMFPSDEVWTGVSTLVGVNAISEWFMWAIGGVVDTDPVLAMLCILTVVHFVVVAVEASVERKKGS
jgi:hypothetical protein